MFQRAINEKWSLLSSLLNPSSYQEAASIDWELPNRQLFSTGKIGISDVRTVNSQMLQLVAFTIIHAQSTGEFFGVIKLQELFRQILMCSRDYANVDKASTEYDKSQGL